jgi:hypothetical protein
MCVTDYAQFWGIVPVVVVVVVVVAAAAAVVVVVVAFEQVVIYFHVGFPFSYSFNLHEVLAEFHVDECCTLSLPFLPPSHPHVVWTPGYCCHY